MRHVFGAITCDSKESLCFANIYSFTKHSLSSHYGLGKVPSTGGTVVNKTWLWPAIRLGFCRRGCLTGSLGRAGCWIRGMEGERADQ